MFVVKVIRPEQDPTLRQFHTIGAAMHWATGDALKEFEGEIQRIEVHEAESQGGLSAMEIVETRGGRLIHAKSNPMKEQAGKVQPRTVGGF